MYFIHQIRGDQHHMLLMSVCDSYLGHDDVLRSCPIAEFFTFVFVLTIPKFQCFEKTCVCFYYVTSAVYA